MANWGASVYALYNKIGGNIRGNICERDGMNVSLYILKNGMHILLVPAVKNGKGGRYSLVASAQASVELAAKYSVKVSAKSIVEKIKSGFGGKDVNPHITGFSRCDRLLNIETSDIDTTRKLFSSSDFRRSMLNNRGLTFEVSPVAETNIHTVSVFYKIQLDGNKPVETLEIMLETVSKAIAAIIGG